MLKGTIRKYIPKFTGIHANEKKKIYLKLRDNKLALKFFNWCENVWVSTKDYGLIRFSPNIWTLLQWKIVEAFFDKDVEFINVLKARQLGGTTICIALNLFSAFIFPDLKGIIVGADYDQIKIPVLKMREMYQSIPRPLRLKKVNDSREMIKFSNGNYFVYFYPARKTSKIGQMGRGGSFNYAHFTEVAFMANERDIEVIESSLSNHYPYRKYIYESTANGYNFWFDRWEANKENPTSRNIFVGWWGREDYVLTNPKELEYYLKRPVFEWEEDKILEVKERYGVTITKEQIAWWRKQAKVKFREDEMAILSEYPFTEDDAFSCSTYDFVEDKPANWLNIHRTPPKRNYQIFWGTRWYEMEIAPSPAGALKTWKGWDEINPYATYIVGVDPAFSTEPDSCNSAFEVLECYADRVEQVAEFSINTIDLQRFALLVLYVATKYNAIINYEVQGGGQAFMPFLQNVYYLKRTIKGGNIWEEIKSAGLREYIYRRRDSLGNQGAKGVVMTWELKRRAFGNLQAYLNNEMLIIRSHSLIDEIRNISFEAGEFVQKRKRSTDRLMALLIALIAYQDVQYTLPTYEEAQERLKKKKEDEKLEEKRRQWRDFNEHLKKIWFEDLFKASKLM